MCVKDPKQLQYGELNFQNLYEELNCQNLLKEIEEIE